MGKVLGIEGELLNEFNNPQVRLGLVGCGSHTYRNIIPCIQFLPAKLVATCDLNIEKAMLYAEKFGAKEYYTDYKEMIHRSNLDGVIAVLGYDDFGSPLYPEVVPNILEASLPVWMEKPPASNANQIQEMKQAMDHGSTFFQVGFKKMFMPTMQKVKEIIDSETFGSIVSYTMRYPVDLPKNSLNLVVGESRRFIDDFVHVASSLIYLIGKPKEMIYYRNEFSGGFATFFHENGAIGNVHFANGASEISPLERLEIVGEGEHVILENNIQLKHYRKGFIGSYGRTPSFIPKEGEVIEITPEFSLGQLYNKGLFLLGYYGELKEFVDCILEKRHPENAHYQDAIDVMQLIDAFSYGSHKLTTLGKPLANRKNIGEPEILKCFSCEGKLVLKDGWNYSCRNCGRSINEKIYKNKLRSNEGGS